MSCSFLAVFSRILFVLLFLQEYAGDGLRTLVLAYKDLDEEYYEEWARRRLQASLAQDSREDRLASIYEEVESDMMVWTGQDRLVVEQML